MIEKGNCVSVMASQINHLARPGTEGVIKPSSFIFDGKLPFANIDRFVSLGDLNFRKILPKVTLITPDFEVLCFRDEIDENKVDRRSISFGTYIQDFPFMLGADQSYYKHDDRWFASLAQEMVEGLKSEVSLQHWETYEEQIKASLTQSKFRYLCMSDTLMEQTHLAIHVFLQVNPIDVLDIFKDETKDHRWSNLKTLYEMHYNSDILLDSWSLAVTDHVLTGNRY